MVLEVCAAANHGSGAQVPRQDSCFTARVFSINRLIEGKGVMGMVEHAPDSDKGRQKNATRTTETTAVEIAFQDWLNTLQSGAPADPDGHACLTGKCGETIEIFLKFEGERVKEAAYRTNGCIASRVCAALAVQMAKGKTSEDLLDITGEAIIEKLDGFPKEEGHCAFLAAETLQEALHSYMLRQVQVRSKGQP